MQEKESNAIDDLEGAEPRLPDEIEFPAPFVLVELSGPDGTNAVRKTITDSLGEFAFASVPEGEYRFRTSYLHFRPRVGNRCVQDRSTRSDHSNPDQTGALLQWSIEMVHDLTDRIHSIQAV